MSKPETTEIPAPTGMIAADGVVHEAAPEQDGSNHTGLLVDGRYKILELIGRGGMGSVYKAEHTGIGRFVALKLLHPSLALLPEVAKRFEREALAIGSIEHPNCVDVSDSGKIEDGSLFLVMEFLEGQSVGDLLADQGHIEPQRALRIMRHMLCGLGHAHQANIVHRDVKPENVFLVNQDGDPDFAKILDFGIAKLVGSTEKDNTKLTQAGVAFGTPAYMSPEQAVGNPVDGRADLYAATVVLYELLAGVAPFRSDDKIEVLSMHTTRPPPPFAESAPHLMIPQNVEALVMCGLAKRPDERFADAAAYVTAIDTVLRQLAAPRVALRMPKRSQTVPVLYAAPASPAERAATELPPPVSPRRFGRGMAVAAAVLGLGLLIAFAVSRGQDSGTEMPTAALPVRTLADRAGDFLTAQKPEEAIALLESEARAVVDDAPAQRELGHAYLATARPRDALRAFERALTLDNMAIHHPTVRKDLQALLDPKDPDVAMDAADIILVRVSDDDAAAARLAELASSTPDLAARARARELAGKHEIMDRVDLVESYALDLVQGERCDDRLAVVATLRELGDARAIPHLEKARHRRSSNPKYRGQNINGCLSDAATAAIEHLEAAARGGE